MEEETSAAGGLCDDAVAEILVRLPSQSVLRCRAVCSRWRRITTDRSFLAAHSARRSREMVVMVTDPPSMAVSAIPLSTFLADAPAPARGSFLCYPSQLGHTASLLYSLDGMLVFEQRPGLYVVCNPVTRQWTNLPALVPEPCFIAFPCGFYSHRPSGEYRLLCHGDESAPWAWTRPAPPRDYYYILAATSSAAATKPRPRRLCRAPEGAPIVLGYETPVAHGDTLYWFSMHPHQAMMLAFHTEAETFRLVPRPPGVAMAALLELDGSLCAAAIVPLPGLGARLDIWALRQDHGTAESCWTLRLGIEMQPPRSSVTSGCVFLVSTAISAGDDCILIGHNAWHVLLLCDLKEKRARKEIHCDSIPCFQVFRESLLSVTAVP